jgi:hypothetical protein
MRRPIWEISIWEGKSHKTPLDKKHLDLLALSIQDARAPIAAQHNADVDSAYDDLKRRRDSDLELKVSVLSGPHINWLRGASGRA